MIHEPRRFACICTRQIGSCDFQGKACGRLAEAEALALYDIHCAPQRERHAATEKARKAGHGSVPDDAPWWIAISNTGHEKRATQGLADRGFEVWWPTKLVEVRVGKRGKDTNTQTREYPAVAGLLFVRHANLQAWPDMIGADGVRGVMTVGFEAATVAVSELDKWRARLAETKMPVVDDAYCIGQQIRITSGPFMTFQGVVEDLLGKGRASVAVAMFGRSTPVEMSFEQIESL